MNIFHMYVHGIFDVVYEILLVPGTINFVI